MKTKKILASLIAVAVIFCILPVVNAAAEGTITESCTIDTGGIFKLGYGVSNVTITVTTSDTVTIVGNGSLTTDKPNYWISIDCSQAENGVSLALDNVWLFNDQSNAEVAPGSDYKNIINFPAASSELIVIGENVIDQNLNASGKAAIHVPPSASLELVGSGTLYLYKREQGAGIGGNAYESGGSITFNGPTIFAKGSKQGALIGSGAGAGATPTGDITIMRGELYLLSNARGAAIGGGAGSGSAAPGGRVFVDGGTLTINVDYTGAAIGGGGYDSGNDSNGGLIYIGKASIKTYIDANAVSRWAERNVTEAGVNAAAITAEILTSDAVLAYPVVINTDSLGLSGINHFDVTDEDENTVYSGGLHRFRYVKDDFIRDDPDKDDPLSTGIFFTRDNWAPVNDPNLYLFLTGENHTLYVNGVEVKLLWNGDGTFTVGGASPEPEMLLGDVDGKDGISTYDASLIGQYLSGKVTFTDQQKLAADVDGKDGITTFDASLIAQLLAGKINAFPD